MGAAHSGDLRTRVVDEVTAARMSRRQAAAHFRVSAASAVRWVSLKAETGGVAPLSSVLQFSAIVGFENSLIGPPFGSFRRG
jgi:transposase